ncbi:MAG TPA: hypothetical protein VNJ47_12690 [Nevskiales bacterium]|nr:hypothetical protein [Nevskiales bacterium]
MNDEPITNRDRALMAAACAELERSIATLDPFTIARLRVARRRALNDAPARGFGWRPALAATLVLTLAAALLSTQRPAARDAAGDWLTAVAESEELYENLEFYQWLEEYGDEDESV